MRMEPTMSFGMRRPDITNNRAWVSGKSDSKRRLCGSDALSVPVWETALGCSGLKLRIGFH